MKTESAALPPHPQSVDPSPQSNSAYVKDADLVNLSVHELAQKVITARFTWRADQKIISSLKTSLADAEQLNHEAETGLHEVEAERQLHTIALEERNEHITSLEAALAEKDAALESLHTLLADLLADAAVLARKSADIKSKLKSKNKGGQNESAPSE